MSLWLGMQLPFPTRMTIVRLDSGALWVHSPIVLDENLVDRLTTLGPVRFLIAPNTIHYWWVPDWQKRFPEARVCAVPDLPRRAKRSFTVDHTLGSAPAPWGEAIDFVLSRGGYLMEADFYHVQSATLILTGLIENFEPARVRSPCYRALVRATGAADLDGKAPIDMRLTFLGHRAALRAAVGRMIAWQPERVILAHGRW